MKDHSTDNSNVSKLTEQKDGGNLDLNANDQPVQQPELESGRVQEQPQPAESSQFAD